MIEHLRQQHVAADQRQGRRRFLGLGLFDQAGDLGKTVLLGLDRGNAVALGLLARHLDDRDDVAAGLLVGRNELRGAGRRADHQLVRQQHRERLVADPVARAPDGMAEAERLLLAREDRIARLDGRVFRLLQLGLLAALHQRRLELVGVVEMILDRALVAAGHEDEFLDAGGEAFLDRILNQRPVDDRQHFLGHRLGRRQEARAEAGNREDGFTDALGHDGRPLS